MSARPRHELPLEVASALADLKAALCDLYGERLCGVYLYGSYARGDYDEQSDVDLLVVIESPERIGVEISRINSFASDICLRYDLLISALPVSSTTFHEARSAFFALVRREAVPV